MECVQDTIFDDSSQKTQLEITNGVYADGYSQNVPCDNDSDNSDNDDEEFSDSMEEDGNLDSKVSVILIRVQSEIRI